MDFLIYLKAFLFVVAIVYIAAIVYTDTRKRKYEKIARRMFAEGTLIPGTVWKHYRNKKAYTIQLVSNAMATGNQWPLIVTYMTAKGYAIFSRPAHEFIRKFILVDSDSNMEPTSYSQIVSLARYAQDRINVPEIDSKWIREFSTPSGKLNSFGHMRMEHHEETVTVRHVTNINQPVQYVNYEDSRGVLRTSTLHNFRLNFRTERKEDVIGFVQLNERNVEAFVRGEFQEGDTVTVKEIVDNEQVTFELSGLEATIIIRSGFSFNVGDEYTYENASLTLRKDNE